MSRRNQITQAPQRPRVIARQRSHLPADGELCRALKGERPRSFGIRRPLESESESGLLFDLKMIEGDGALPDNTETRNSLHVTLMPRRRLDRQLRQGIVAGYEFGKRSVALRQEIEHESPDRLVATLGGAAVFKGHNLGLHVECAGLVEEYDMVRELMGRIGIKGTLRDPGPLHISLATFGKHSSRVDKQYAVEVANEIMPIGDVVLLEPIMFYPNHPTP